MNRKFGVVGFFICFLFIFNAFSLEENQDDILKELFLYAKQSIDRVENKKIFLKPEKVYFSEHKLFLETEIGRDIVIPKLFSDRSGIFLTTVESSSEYRIMKKWDCANCNTSYTEDDLPTECQVCHHKKFAFHWIIVNPDGSFRNLD